MEGVLRWKTAMQSGEMERARKWAREVREGRKLLVRGPASARLVLRLLDVAMASTVDPDAAWRIARNGHWFQPPGGAPVDMSRRAALVGILAAVAAARESDPESRLCLEDLVRAGWPGENIIEKAAKNRVYVAVSTLRKAGLAPLVRVSGGWCLDPKLPVAVVVA